MMMPGLRARTNSPRTPLPFRAHECLPPRFARGAVTLATSILIGIFRSKRRFRLRGFRRKLPEINKNRRNPAFHTLPATDRDLSCG